jgi:hypothetical protein
MPCPPVTDVLPPATPFETKTTNPTSKPTPPSDSHCQFSYHLVHASNPNYPHTPAPSCLTSNQTLSPGSSVIRIPRIPAFSTPTTVPSPSSTHFTVSLPVCLGADEIAYFILKSWCFESVWIGVLKELTNQLSIHIFKIECLILVMVLFKLWN